MAEWNGIAKHYYSHWDSPLSVRMVLRQDTVKEMTDFRHTNQQINVGKNRPNNFLERGSD